MLHSTPFSTLRNLGFCAICLFSACQQASEASFSKQAPPPPPEALQNASPEAQSAPGKAKAFQDAATHGDVFSSSAAIPSGIDSLKKFVRSAELRFRVNNTVQSTLQIEDIVARNGGFMVGSNLSTALELRQTTVVSADSALETTRYSIHSQLVIRVPYRMLDTTLRSIGRLSDFLDHRNVNAEDVGLQMLDQSLTRLREGIYQDDLEASEASKMQPKPERARESRAASDQARIETLKLEDAIRFSTIRVDLYQLPQIRRTMVANVDVPTPQPAFAIRFGAALSAGGEILLIILMGIVHLWGVILLGVLGYFTWKWLQKRPRQATPTPQ